MNKAREELLNLLREESYEEGEFILASGRKSDYYFDCKKTTLHRKGSYLVGRVFLEEIIKVREGGFINGGVIGVGGLETGAIPISTAVVVLAEGFNLKLAPFFVRSKLKDHGTKKYVEGSVDGLKEVIIIDDVVTTGDSTIKAIEGARDAGLEPIFVIALVDREEGGKENIEKKGVKFKAIFKTSEIRGR